MNYRFACLALAALGAAALPHAAAAADYYDEGAAAPVYQGRDEAGFGADRIRVPRRREAAPADRRVPGPVVFDERAPEWGSPPPRPALAGPGYRYGDPGFAGPRGFGPDDGYGPPERPSPRFRPVPAPLYGAASAPLYGAASAPLYGAASAPLYGAVSAPLYGDAFDPRFGRPDAGCTVERSESITPAGWRKIVTHRTCYHR